MENYDNLINEAEKQKDEKTKKFIENTKKRREECYTVSNDTAVNVVNDIYLFKEYLNIQAKFPKYSASNALLILANKPEATQLGDYSYWRKRNIFIKENEKYKTFAILEPGDNYIREDNSKGTYYNPKEVYDISQTNSRVNNPQVEYNLDEVLKALINNSPVPIITAPAETIPDNKVAFYNYEQNLIVFATGQSDGEKLFKEATEAMANARFETPDINSFYAEAISYMLSKRYNIQKEDLQLSEIPQDLKESDCYSIREKLDYLNNTANEISNQIENNLEKTNRNTEKSRDVSR